MKKCNFILYFGIFFILRNISMGGPAPLSDRNLKKLINDSEYILIGEVERIVEIKNNPGYIPTYDIKYIYKISEVIKGDITEEEINIFGRVTHYPPREGTKGIIFLGKYKYKSQYRMLTNIWKAKDEYLIKIKKYIKEDSKLNEH